jgi:colanic acid/amylovoran biosynthesis glycosyltransferase
MKRIAYLLHRFPRTTDTFIRREIRSLQEMGTDVQVISIWKPKQHESTQDILGEWIQDTQFALPRSVFSIVWILATFAIRSPMRFLATARLAFLTSRPGVRGFVYQCFYFVEAVLAAALLCRNVVAHVHNHIGDHSGTVTMLAAKLAGIGYSVTFHGWPVFFDAKYSRIKEKVHEARFTRSISYFCRSQLMMFSECDDPTSFKIVHCGLEIKQYPYRQPRKEIKYLLCVARLSSEKGHSSLIHALRLLRNEGYDMELRLAGNGPTMEQLTTLAEELGLAQQVHFLGHLSEDEVIRELQRSDLFVLPSFVEGLPVSAMEAMAVGLPVIATNIAGTSELIEDGKTGILVRPSDPDALAHAVVRMTHDYPFRLRAAELGRKRVMEEFDIHKETAKLNEYLLQAAIASHDEKCGGAGLSATS